MRTVGSHAFGKCPIEGLYIPSTLTDMKSDAFGGISFLDASGNALERTARALRGHSFEGFGWILAMTA